MKIVNWLRKLGILRYGTKQYTYTSGKDMSAEALMDDVYDGKKDLLSHEGTDTKENDKETSAEPKKTKKESKMWKKILGAIVVIIALFVGLVMWSTSGMSEAANEFFILVKTKNYDDAYNETSTDFKKSISLKEFESFIKDSGLSKYKSVSWDSRSIENNMGKLEGAVTTESGDAIPIKMEFLKSGEKWKIFSISKQAAGVKKVQESQNDKVLTKKSQAPVADKEEHLNLVRDSTMIFAKAVNQKSMKTFYVKISKVWQNQTDIGSLDKVFAVFYDAGIDFTVLKNVTPVIEKEEELPNGVLVLKGYYPSTPSRAYFDYKYFYEDGTWKLVGFNINVK